MNILVESLSKLPLDNLKNMKKSFKWIYNEDPSNDNLENLIIVEQALKLCEGGAAPAGGAPSGGGGGGVAMANQGNVGGMGNVVSAQVGSIPGQPGTSGSGDYGMALNGNSAPQSDQPQGLGKLLKKLKGNKKLQKKLKGKGLLSYNDFLKKKK